MKSNAKIFRDLDSDHPLHTFPSAGSSTHRHPTATHSSSEYWQEAWSKHRMLLKLPTETLTQIIGHFALTLPAKDDVFPDFCIGRKHAYEADDLASRLLQDRRTLRILCLVHSRCHAVASLLLYQTVILEDAAALPFFLRTLLECPKAGEVVRVLAVVAAFNASKDEIDLYKCTHMGLWAEIGRYVLKKRRATSSEANLTGASCSITTIVSPTMTPPIFKSKGGERVPWS